MESPGFARKENTVEQVGELCLLVAAAQSRRLSRARAGRL